MKALLEVHLFVLLSAYLLLLAASGLGLLFLFEERLLKRRDAGLVAMRLPPLDLLERRIYTLTLIAFPFLTAGLLTGMPLARSAWGSYWSWNPKEVFALAIWVIYGSVLLIRHWGGWRGRKSTYVSLVGFVLAVLTWIFVRPLSPGGS